LTVVLRRMSHDLLKRVKAKAHGEGKGFETVVTACLERYLAPRTIDEIETRMRVVRLDFRPVLHDSVSVSQVLRANNLPLDTLVKTIACDDHMNLCLIVCHESFDVVPSRGRLPEVHQSGVLDLTGKPPLPPGNPQRGGGL
jgi:hypothetical protein